MAATPHERDISNPEQAVGHQFVNETSLVLPDNSEQLEVSPGSTEQTEAGVEELDSGQQSSRFARRGLVKVIYGFEPFVCKNGMELLEELQVRRHGDTTQLEVVLRTIKNYVAYRFTSNQYYEVEDIVSEVAVAIPEMNPRESASGTIAFPSMVMPYIWGITIKKIAQMRRLAQQHERRIRKSTTLREAEFIQADLGVAAILDRTMLTGFADRHDLSTQDREIIAQIAFGTPTDEEMAERDGVTKGAIRARRHQLMRKLRQISDMYQE